LSWAPTIKIKRTKIGQYKNIKNTIIKTKIGFGGQKLKYASLKIKLKEG
jgi:hypothetical protein